MRLQTCWVTTGRIFGWEHQEQHKGAANSVATAHYLPHQMVYATISIQAASDAMVQTLEPKSIHFTTLKQKHS